MNCFARKPRRLSLLHFNVRDWRTFLINLLYVVCTLSILLFSQAAWSAEEPSRPAVIYTVELNGAGNLTRFLNENLDLIRRIKEPGLHPEEFRRLAGAATRQIRELLA